MDSMEAEARQEVERVVKELTDHGVAVQLDGAMPVFGQLIFVLTILHAKLTEVVQNS